jgi:hypothetical protein
MQMNTLLNLQQLPEIETLKLRSQSLAILDAIICAEWENRYYSFTAKWNHNEMLASMRNGSGDGYFILFTEKGSIIKGFSHESQMSPYKAKPNKIWSGVIENVPIVFSGFLQDNAISIEESTFCIWRTNSDLAWNRGKIKFPNSTDPDGAIKLLAVLIGDSNKYIEYAKNYYEIDIEPDLIDHIYLHKPITQKIISSLHSARTRNEISTEIKEIGY